MATYDPKKVQVTLSPVGGNITVGGYADGSFIEIEPEDDAFERVTGSDGTVAWVNKQRWCNQITITILQTSSTNAELTLLHNADKLSNNGVFGVEIKDFRGNSLFKCFTARIVREPTVTWSRDVENREWLIHTEEALNAIGGTN